MAAKKKYVPDPARSLALLWGPKNQTGRSGISLSQIVDGAIRLADADPTGNLEALSMRNLAEELKIGAMTLYTYVPSKIELTELMLDAVVGRMYGSVDEPSSQGSWQDCLRFVAGKNWELFRNHPWVLALVPGRPVLGPHISLKYEAELRCLDGIGLTDVQMDASLTLVLTHVEGCARVAASLRRAEMDSGMSDLEWWQASAPVMERFEKPGSFPVASRVGTAAGMEYQASAAPVSALEFGLDRILAGIQCLLDERAR